MSLWWKVLLTVGSNRNITQQKRCSWWRRLQQESLERILPGHGEWRSPTSFSISFRTLYSRLKKYKNNPATKDKNAERIGLIMSLFLKVVRGIEMKLSVLENSSLAKLEAADTEKNLALLATATAVARKSN